MRTTPIFRPCASLLATAVAVVVLAGCGDKSRIATKTACRSSESIKICVRSLPGEFEWTGRTQTIQYEVTLKPLGRADRFQLVQVPPVHSDEDGAMILPDQLTVGPIGPPNSPASSNGSSGTTAAAAVSSPAPGTSADSGAAPGPAPRDSAAVGTDKNEPRINAINGIILSDRQTSEFEPGGCAISEPQAAHSSTSPWRRTTTLRLFHRVAMGMRFRHEISKARPWPGLGYSSTFSVRPLRSSEPWLSVSSPAIRTLGTTGVRLQLTQSEPPTGIDWASMKRLPGRRLAIHGRIDASGRPDVILRFWGISPRGSVISKELSRVRPAADGTFSDILTGLPSVSYGEIRAVANAVGRLEYATCPRAFWSAGKPATLSELYDAVRHR